MFLREKIKDQKFLEMEVSFDEFIKENNISEKSIIQKLSLDKSVFADETEVREYVKNIYYEYSPKIESDDQKYNVVIFSDQQVDESTEVVIELRRGVTAYAYDIRPIEHKYEIEFNAKGVKSFVSKIDTIDFNDGLPHIIEIARVAKGFHPRYGTIELTKDHLQSFVKNFNSQATGVDLAVNEDHEKKEAFGWYKDVWLSHDGDVLYGSIVWNNKGVSALSNKDYRYFSPEFNFDYTHELTGEKHGPTLLGGALTNYPFLKMGAIVDMNNKQQKEDQMSKEAKTIDLSTHTEKVVELNGKINSMQVELNAKISENQALEAKVKELNDTIELNAKKATHKKLFDDGHINAAQLDALNEGKGMLEVLSLNSKMNTNETGSAGSKKDVSLNDGQKKVADSFGLTEEEFASIDL